MMINEDRQLRLAGRDDWPAIARLDEDTLGSTARAEMLRQAVQEQRCYLVTGNGEIAAFGVLNHHFFDQAFLELLVVDSRLRRQGIGRMLLMALRDICQTEKLFTSTNVSNQPMRQLLQACGWQRCGFVDQLDPGDPELIYCHTRSTKQGLEPPLDSAPGVAVVPLSFALLPDVNRPNQPFPLIGRAVPRYCDDRWTWSEEVYAEATERRFPDEEMDYSHYIASKDHAMFLAYVDGVCVGQIRMRRNWNRYCYIEDIEVGRAHRQLGIGKQLIAAAIAWAKAGGMPGLMLEAQDVNLIACRFYQRLGFTLGGVDTLLYANTPSRGERAMFWYMAFQQQDPETETQPTWGIVPLNESLRPAALALLTERWGSSVIASQGKAHQAADLPGFVALAGEQLMGLVTYQITGDECEIVSLDSLHEGQGIGTALLEQVIAVTREAECRRVWLITTNDNTPAIHYYQRRGFDLVAVHRQALTASRLIKPEIPLIGLDDIPLRHELEFELLF